MKKEAYHGTTHSNAAEIALEGFRASLGNAHWLGDGVYFFVDGIGYEPLRAAELWAEYRAYKNKESQCAVIKSMLEADDAEILDLTTYEGIRIINYIQRQCAQRLASIGRAAGYVDGYIINFAREKMGLNFSIVIGNEYIQLEEEDRKYGIRRRTSNCTICAVCERDKIKNVKTIKEWRI